MFVERRNYYVTPYEDCCELEREGEGLISVHQTRAEAVQVACKLASACGVDVMVRYPRPGRRGDATRASA